MVGISSTLRLVTLAIVAISMSRAAVVEGEADIAAAVAEKAESPDAGVPKGYIFFVAARIHNTYNPNVSGDAVPYVSEASAAAVVDKAESPSVVQGYVFCVYCADL